MIYKHTMFRVIYRYSTDIVKYRDARAVAVRMSNHRFGEYIIIKSDEKGDRIVNLIKSQGYVDQIEKLLNDA